MQIGRLAQEVVYNSHRALDGDGLAHSECAREWKIEGNTSKTYGEYQPPLHVERMQRYLGEGHKRRQGPEREERRCDCFPELHLILPSAETSWSLRRGSSRLTAQLMTDSQTCSVPDSIPWPMRVSSDLGG